MCDENERAYERMINGDMSSQQQQQLSNDEFNPNLIEQNAPPSISFSSFCYSVFLICV
jgi:hypothetical protein